MIEELPVFNSLSAREIQVLEALLGGSFALNGHSKELEQSILKKTNTATIQELVSLLHREMIQSKVSDREKINSVDHFLKDPRFQRFQVFADQSVRILDNATHQYLYVNEASENLMGWPAEDIRKGGLRFGHKKTHPWDLLQVRTLPSRLNSWKPSRAMVEQIEYLHWLKLILTWKKLRVTNRARVILVMEKRQVILFLLPNNKHIKIPTILIEPRLLCCNHKSRDNRPKAKISVQNSR